MFASRVFKLFNSSKVVSSLKGRKGVLGSKLGAASLLSSILLYHSYQRRYGLCKDDAKIYTKEEIGKHTSQDTGIWIMYKNKVYDITQFVENHPGGKIILSAAGKHVEPFFNTFTFHKSFDVGSMIEPYLIGSVAEKDWYRADEASEKVRDIYENDPVRDGRLIVLSQKPFNAETPLSLLTNSFITPNNIFFIRNHMPVPFLNPKKHELDVCIQKKFVEKVNDKPADFYREENFKVNENKVDDCLCHKFTLGELMDFEERSVTSIIQCSGNRRSEMNKAKAVQGLDWKGGAIGNAKWTGVKLIDVLKSCGLSIQGSPVEAIGHARFVGADRNELKEPYETSVPLNYALDPNAILSFKMNDEDIPLDHGFPLRVIIPGVTGARNVKWLEKIIVAEEESQTRWQIEDYKCYSPSTQISDKNKAYVPPIYETPVTSMICKPANESSIAPTSVDGNPHVSLEGFAYSGGGNKIVRVEVSADAGKTWNSARISSPQTALPKRDFSWTFWNVDIPVSKEQEHMSLLCKAVDSSYNQQPESSLPFWNFRGLLTNSWHQIHINLINPLHNHA